MTGLLRHGAKHRARRRLEQAYERELARQVAIVRRRSPRFQPSADQRAMVRRQVVAWGAR